MSEVELLGLEPVLSYGMPLLQSEANPTSPKFSVVVLLSFLPFMGTERTIARAELDQKNGM